MNTLSDLMFADRKDIYLSSFHIKDNLFETICIKKLKAKIFDWRKRKIISLYFHVQFRTCCSIRMGLWGHWFF